MGRDVDGDEGATVGIACPDCWREAAVEEKVCDYDVKGERVGGRQSVSEATRVEGRMKDLWDSLGAGVKEWHLAKSREANGMSFQTLTMMKVSGYGMDGKVWTV